jgi:hypothetical protein
MFDMLVTDEVSNCGTDTSERQLLNMLDMFVTDEVSNSGTDVNEAQS